MIDDVTKANWINEYGLLLFRNKYNKNLVLNRPYCWCKDTFSVVDESDQNRIVQTPKLEEINFKDWIPITRDQYVEKYMKNDIKPSNESKGSYVPPSNAIKFPKYPFITGTQIVEDEYKRAMEKCTKHYEKIMEEYKEQDKEQDQINKEFKSFVEDNPDYFNIGYIPEKVTVEKDTIYAAIRAVENGLEYANECLTVHDRSLGRTTYKNKTWAETMENDIKHMENVLEMLKKEPKKEYYGE